MAFVKASLACALKVLFPRRQHWPYTSFCSPFYPHAPSCLCHHSIHTTDFAPLLMEVVVSSTAPIHLEVKSQGCLQLVQFPDLAQLRGQVNSWTGMKRAQLRRSSEQPGTGTVQLAPKKYPRNHSLMLLVSWKRRTKASKPLCHCLKVGRKKKQQELHLYILTAKSFQNTWLVISKEFLLKL